MHAYYIVIKLLLQIRKGHNCEKGGKDIICKLLSVGKIPRGSQRPNLSKSQAIASTVAMMQ